MKRYYSRSGTCSCCGKPTEVQVMNESFANRTILATASICCESPVLNDDGKEIMLRDLEEAGYEG